MSCLNKNMDYLKKIDKVMYDNIKDKILHENNDETNILICKNLNESLNIKIEKNNRSFYLHSQYATEVEAEKWVNSLNSNAKIIIVLGLGLGYHIKTLLKVVSPETCICIIEPDNEIFKAFIENVDIRSVLDERVIFLINNNSREISAEIFGLIKKYIMEEIEIKIFNSYIIEYKSLFNDIEKNVIEAIHNLQVNLGTMEYFKYLWTLNSFVNCYNVKDASNGIILRDKFKNMPAIIISAGPSLDKNIEYLKKLKNKALFIAGGSAIGILKKNGIDPHFMVAIDGSQEEKDIFDAVDFNNTALVYLHRLYYEIAPQYKDKRFFLVDSEDFISKYFTSKTNLNYAELPPSQTVAGINIDLACFMGCNPILFVGQDLAYTNMEMHAKGAAHMVNFEEELKNTPDKFISMKDINGDKVYTIKPFLTTRKSMGEKVEKYKKSNIEFFNATEGGIGIENAENISLKEAALKYLNKEYALEEIIEWSYNEGVDTLTEEVIEAFFMEIMKEVEYILNIAQKRYEICEKIISLLEQNKIDYEKYKKYAIQINKYEEILEKSEFCKYIIIGAIGHTLNIHRTIAESNLAKTQDAVEQNKIKTQSMKNQSVEIIGVCNLILNMKNLFKK